MSGRPCFDLDRVGVTIDGHRILEEVTLQIAENELTVLMGESGSGKSTLLRLLNRLQVPDSGSIHFRGTDLATLDVLAHRRRVGMVFQRPTLFEGTVADNLRVADAGLDDAAIATLLGRVNLPAEFADRSGGNLSGGEAQRACLARSLAAGPEVLLMDEATSALDEENRAELEAMTRALVSTQRLTVVWVTHDRRQMERIADRVVRIEAGRVSRP